MEFDNITRVVTKKLMEGQTYRAVREELLDRFYPEDALKIATESYKNFKKEKIKSFFKYLFINILVLIVVYFIAPKGHALKPKISYIMWGSLIIKSIYDWYRYRKADKEYKEATENY